MEHVCLKGGTAIRKFYAGREGRFSLDLDFSIDDQYTDSEERALDFVSEIDGLRIGPFTYSVSERRNNLSAPFHKFLLISTGSRNYSWLNLYEDIFILQPP